MNNSTLGQPGPSQEDRLICLLETDDSVQEDKPAVDKQGERREAGGKKEELPPLETPFEKESKDFAPKIKVNLNYRRQPASK